MKPKHRSPIWPYLGILTCLFVLSITAPRAWDRMSRRELSATTHPPVAMRSSRVAYRPGSVRYENIDVTEWQPRVPITVDQQQIQQHIAPPMASETAKESVSVEAAAVAPSQIIQLPPPPAPVVPPVPEVADIAPIEPQPTPEIAPLETVSADASPLVAQVTEPIQETASEAPAAEEAQATEESPLAESAPTVEQTITPLEQAPVWPVPRALVEQLTKLSEMDRSAVWAQHALNLIHQLCQHGPAAQQGVQPLAELRRLVTSDAFGVANRKSDALAIRTRYALNRWIDVWEAAAVIDAAQAVPTVRTAADDHILAAVRAVEVLTRRGTGGAAWRKYLKLDTIRDLAHDNGDEALRRATARKVLDRLSSSRLTREQHVFIREASIVALQRALSAWAGERVTAERLLKHLEAYEHTGLASDAKLVADDYRGLAWSAPAEAARLSTHLDTHYRNANVRVAVAGPLVNRMVPQPEQQTAPVHDVVVNVPVHGCSTTNTNLSVLLVPDPQRIRLGLLANGMVDSNTVSKAGPARLHNEGRSSFVVRKLFVYGPRGLTVWPAVAEADNDYTSLVSLDTGFDNVPLVGSLVRMIARSQYEESKPLARMEVEQKVAMRARDQLDAEVQPAIEKAAEKFEQNQLATLKRLGLELVPIELSTTTDRIVARQRLGTPEQLGAHTPRPRAPSDSWLTFQLHESALNNGLTQLNLDGRKFELAELFQWISDKLNKPEMTKLDDMPEGVRMEFAEKDAIRVRCEGDRLEVMLSFAELTQDRRKWRNFTVRTYYRPDVQGLNARFVRDDTIRLDGKSLQGKIEPKLRAIFSRVLSKNRPINLMSEKALGDERLQDLEVTQFSVEDGWIGLAYSQKRAGGNVARRPK